MLSPCGNLPSTGMCGIETTFAEIARQLLPEDTSLYATVALFTKLSMAMHDALVVLTTLQHGFWFWRPIMAYRAGDPDHAPIPDWNPFLPTPAHAEYPSGAVTSTATALAETTSLSRFRRGPTHLRAPRLVCTLCITKASRILCTEHNWHGCTEACISTNQWSMP